MLTTIPNKHDCDAPNRVLRPATETDLPNILALERTPEFRNLVGTWTEEEHARALRDADLQYLIILDATDGTAGFAILRGILSPHMNIELKRLVIAAPGHGLGQRALAALKALAFDSLGAHRLWLDVFATNARALHVYRKAGFRQEGILLEAIYRDGEFHTLLLLAMLDREYFSG
jgi:diamine N-acetyltransferase